MSHEQKTPTPYADALARWLGEDWSDEAMRATRLAELGARHQYRRQLDTHDARRVAGDMLTAICRGMPSGEFTAAAALIELATPAPSVERPAMLAYYESAAKRVQDRRVRAKPGRVFAKLLPTAGAATIARLADDYRERYDAAPLVLKTGAAREDFRHAYTHAQAPMANPSTSSDRKSLAYSCMRHDFSHLPCHPVEAYASGDFSIAWLEDGQGRIAGRVVICDAKGNHGPVYGVSEAAMNQLESHLAACSITPARYGGWQGAALLAIDDGDAYVAPYVDVEPRAADIGRRDGRRLLVITADGEHSLERTDGLTEEHSRCQCPACGDRLDEDETLSDDVGNQYCEHCYWERYTVCDHSGETIDRDDAVTVYFSRCGHHLSETWSQWAADRDAVRCEDGEYWIDTDVIHARGGEALSPVDVESGGWVECEFSGEWIPAAEAEELDGGGFADLGEIPEGWQKHDNGVWYDDQLKLNVA